MASVSPGGPWMFTYSVCPSGENVAPANSSSFNALKASGKVSPASLMPMSHWSYELDFGSRDWMPAALNAVGVGGDELVTRANGAALEFDVGERAKFQSLLVQLLSNLRTSDFMLAFPGRPVTCTIHHHKQLWWTSPDAGLIETLGRMAQL